MARPKKTETTTKPKTTSKAVKAEEKESSVSIEELMAQVKALTETVKKQEEEKSDLKELISALKSDEKTTDNKPKKDLPNKVKVVSLLQNCYNLSTEEMGGGKCFTFPEFGHTITMRVSDLEDVLSIETYRLQAEKGYFYICNDDVVEELGLSDEYKTIVDKKAMNHVVALDNDSSVDLFCSLDSEMRDSVATKIAENIVANKPVDRNRVFEIKRRINVDIEKIAENLKNAREKTIKK